MKTLDSTINKTKKINKRLEELREFFKVIEPQLHFLEKERMELELTLIEGNINALHHHEVSEQLIEVLNSNTISPLEGDPFRFLDRMYEFAKFGCKSSCESSANILLEIEKALKNKNRDEYEFVSIKGHMAPFMYANEYTKSNFSLVYLYALHYSDIISPVLKDKFIAKGVDVFYNLGYGLGKVLSKMMVNPKKKYIVLIGDSDLTFGATLEALMYIKTQNYNNITLVVDFNRFGFEARPEGFDTNILKSFFEYTLVVDEKELKESLDFRDILFSLKRGAVFVNTVKENHRVKLFSAKTNQVEREVRLTEFYGKLIAKFNQSYQKEIRLFTPDLASRFSLQENNVSYINTTVSEALTPLLALEENGFSVIATDQKYATNMIGSILELYKSSGSVLLTLAKSWDYWGGEANALNLLNTLPDMTVYEPCSKKELALLLEAHYVYPLYKSIISVADVALPKIDFEPNLKGANYLMQNKSKKLIISFGMATAMAYEVADKLKIDLIHFAKMRVNYTDELQRDIEQYEHVYLLEYNGLRNGFSEHFLSVYHLENYTIHASKEEIPQMKAINQIRHHGFSSDQLKSLFTKKSFL